MGLDQFCFRAKDGLTITTPVNFLQDDPDGAMEGAMDDHQRLHYWRRHPNLHGWMEKLYVAKGGKSPVCDGGLLLTRRDLETLMKDILDDKLPETHVPFFGDNADAEMKDETLEWIVKCFAVIKEGYDVWYTAGW